MAERVVLTSAMATASMASLTAATSRLLPSASIAVATPTTASLSLKCFRSSLFLSTVSLSQKRAGVPRLSRSFGSVVSPKCFASNPDQLRSAKEDIKELLKTTFCHPIMDATANDIPRETFDVKGYPTLYFISASGKVLRYEGGRTKDSFISFIQKNRDKYTEQSSVKEEL